MKKIIFLFLIYSLCLPLFAKVPNSPLYKYQYWAKNNGGELKFDHPFVNKNIGSIITCKGVDLNLEPAWDISTGSKDVIVAIIDDGFPYEHQNIKENIWSNPGELGKDKTTQDKRYNQIDDDNNQYIDDVHGYNFADDNGDPNPYTWWVDRAQSGNIGIYTHGATALGIIGAKGNTGTGIAGINWNISMMLLKVINTEGAGVKKNKGHAANVAKAIRYAVDNGARVINWSGFIMDATKKEEQLVVKAFEYAKQKEVLIVVAAGNMLKDLDKQKAPFPLSGKFDNVILVANIDACGYLAGSKNKNIFSSGSNYGKKSVFIAAPAEKAVTTYVSYNGYDAYTITGGTSNAAPMVTGVLGLMLSIDPLLTYKELKDIICQSTHTTSELQDKLSCGGYLDAGKALELTKKYLSK